MFNSQRPVTEPLNTAATHLRKASSAARRNLTRGAGYAQSAQDDVVTGVRRALGEMKEFESRLQLAASEASRNAGGAIKNWTTRNPHLAVVSVAATLYLVVRSFRKRRAARLARLEYQRSLVTEKSAKDTAKKNGKSRENVEAAQSAIQDK